MSTRKKSIIMFALAIVLIIMGVGYASARTLLLINGTANLEATWDVSITGITEGEAKGKAYNKETPSYTGTNATFNVGFKSLGDSMDYEVTITNNGTMDAVVSSINARFFLYTGEEQKQADKKLASDYVSYLITGIKEGDVLKSGESKNFHIIFDYPEYLIMSTDLMTSIYRINVEFEQYTNQSYEQIYKVNDRVMLEDGNIWRVLKPSSENEETILLIKENYISKSKKLVFDENKGHDFESSTLKTYLNSTYKSTLPETMVSKIVGDITIPTAGNYTYEGELNFDENAELPLIPYTQNDNSGYVVDLLRQVHNKYSNQYHVDNSVNLKWLGVIKGSDSSFFLDYMYMLNAGNMNITNISDYKNSDDAFSGPIVAIDLNYENGIYNSKLWSLCHHTFINEECACGLSGIIALGDAIPTDYDSPALYPVITINKSAIK